MNNLINNYDRVTLTRILFFFTLNERKKKEKKMEKRERHTYVRYVDFNLNYN